MHAAHIPTVIKGKSPGRESVPCLTAKEPCWDWHKKFNIAFTPPKKQNAWAAKS